MKITYLICGILLGIWGCRGCESSNPLTGVDCNIDTEGGKKLCKGLYYSTTGRSSESLVSGDFALYNVDDEVHIYDKEKDLKLNFFKTSNTNKPPLIVFLPPGGFIKYDKDEALTRHLCREFARAGYHTASISYSLLSKPNLSDAFKWRSYVKGKIADAMCDVSHAIDYLEYNSDDLGFDPDNIILCGYSAGGVLALHSIFSKGNEINGEYLDEDDLHVHYSPPNIRGVISISGALLVDHIDDSDNSDIPLLMFHGNDDNIVPIGYGTPYDVFIRDWDIDLPGTVLTAAFTGSQGQQITGEFSSHIHLPKWLFELTLGNATPKVWGSGAIYHQAKGNIDFYEVQNGNHTFMVSEKGMLNDTYRAMRIKMLEFIKANTKIQ